MKRYRLEIVVFLCGAVVMVLELAGSRIVAPYLGTSIYVWTSLIGVILASLSLGYWWGGKMADKKPDYKTFSLLILISALLIGLINLINQPVLLNTQHVIDDMRLGALAAAIILFAPASVFLGTVSPYAVKLKMKDLDHSGATVGRLYAISTIGSIAGTFSTGFFLISFFGSSNILMFLSITLLIVSFIAYGGSTSIPRKSLGIAILLVLIFSLPLKKNAQTSTTLDIDTRYNRVIVEEMIDEETGKPIRSLRMDNKWSQSAVLIDEPTELYFEYNKYYHLVDHFLPNNREALLIGGGTYTFARDYIARMEGRRIDVIEIDSKLTELAKKYFFLKDDPGIHSIHDDGRLILDRTRKKYDVVFVDVFKSSASPPFHLTTLEAARSMSKLLRKEGAVLVNIYSAIEGNKGKFLRAIYATYKTVFPQVFLFPVQQPSRGDMVQNVILVGLKAKHTPIFKSTQTDLKKYLSHKWQKKIKNDMPILTDNFAPVEHYLLEVTRNL